MSGIRIVPPNDETAFPYQEAALRLLSFQDLEVGKVDFARMIEVGKRIGWTIEMIEEHERLAKNGKCFTFNGQDFPYLSGTLFEDNIFFSFESAEHQTQCEPVIESLAKELNLDTIRF